MEPKSSASTSSATSADPVCLGEARSNSRDLAMRSTGTSSEQESGAGGASPTKSPASGSADVPIGNVELCPTLPQPLRAHAAFLWAALSCYDCTPSQGDVAEAWAAVIQALEAGQ